MFVHNDRYAEYMNKMEEGLCPECGGSLEHLEEEGGYKYNWHINFIIRGIEMRDIV